MAERLKISLDNLPKGSSIIPDDVIRASRERINKSMENFLIEGKRKKKKTMTSRYLVIWQLGSNEQSKTETPIDVNHPAEEDAANLYNRILRELRDTDHDADEPNILGIFKL